MAIYYIIKIDNHLTCEKTVWRVSMINSNSKPSETLRGFLRLHPEYDNVNCHISIYTTKEEDY